MAKAAPRLVGYLRVSTDRQAEEGLGLEVQRQAIKEWAKAGGFRLHEWCRDEGLSGTKGLGERDGLADALDLVRSKRAAGLVVYRLDRLARDLVLQETLLAELRRLGGELYSTSPAEQAYLSDDPDDPSRKLIRQVLGAVSEYERAMIALRLRAGRRRKHEKGGFAYGSPPFGYMAVNGELVPVESEQNTISRMRDLSEQGVSLRQIATTLDREAHMTRKGGRWQPVTVQRVLERP